jgi:predicted amidophosphoribosyltransferase
VCTARHRIGAKRFRSAHSVHDVLDLLFPRRCLVCRRSGPELCAGCRGALPRVTPPLCGRCGAPTAWPVERCRECAGRRLAFANARAAILYNDAARALVGGWKERGLRRIAGLAAELVVLELPRPDAGGVAFVPPDGDRSLRRGHHPAQRLAEEVAARWELPVLRVLVRTRAVRRQRGLPLAERRRNVAGAFGATGRVPSRVCLVDDVYTSGSTASAAASALRAAGARWVDVVTFARAVR